MNPTIPLYLRVLMFFCQILSFIIAVVHKLFFKIGILKLSSVILNAPGKTRAKLQWMWFVRSFRRCISVLVRSPLRKDVLRLINFDPNSIAPGSVIVSCHTPWARLITQWCAENNYAMIVGWGPWTKRVRIARHATGLNELRDLAKYLCSGGRIIIMADIFNDLNNCPVKFFEKPCNASLVPLRLAKITNTVLVSVVPSLKNNRIQINAGPRLSFDSGKNDPGKTMQTLLSYFEKEIRYDPSVWSGYVRGSLAIEV